MKINSIQQKNNQNFKGMGSVYKKITDGVVNRPGLVSVLAGSSVVAQKIVMSGSEAVVGPIMDVGIGKVITKATGETDGRTNESSKVQAIRTFAQSVGGTIVGVCVRVACISAATYAFMKLGGKAGGKIASVVNEGLSEAEKANAFLHKDNMEKWGKTVGGALATIVMVGTNFLIDVPFINLINKKTTEIVDKFEKNKTQKKEVK